MKRRGVPSTADTSDGFTGVLSGVRIWTRALTAEEIQSPAVSGS